MDLGGFLLKLRTLGLEYFGRYYGIYKGIVTKNDLGQGRIKVMVPELGRNDELNNEAYPISPFAGKRQGFFFPPDEGELVWIMFEGGNPELPVYLGGWWTKGSEPVDSGGDPTIREIRTKAGHRIIMDESKGITLQTPNGVIIRLKDDQSSIEITATQDVSIKASTANVKSQQVNVTGNFVNVAGSMVRINNGTRPAAAIGDAVAGAGPIVGPPIAGRPLIP
jgi:uncharacterized protein involved in type VI secretion and phage assembly